MKYSFDNASSTDAIQGNYCPEVQVNFISYVKNQLLEMLRKGGPEPQDYGLMDDLMHVLYLGYNNDRISDEDIQELKAVFDKTFLDESIHGYAYRKPLGYAGDYALIDKIYTYEKSGNPLYRTWDNYFHHNEATEAVRNRKAYFKKQLNQKLEGKKDTLNLLNVASGPARDLYELYQGIDAKKLKSTCVDIDQRAIDFATELCGPFNNQINFVNKNILRFNSTEKFDVIWSAGLFDYFEDRIFVLALKRMLSLLKPGGEIIVGNFSKDNSSRGYMELFGEWYLIHRSQGELTRLALEAGVLAENVWVDKEPLGINYFLRLKTGLIPQESSVTLN